ncbi:MAG: polysaccharide deacetylase family protein [Desulfovibrio sp.]|nr:polysaccharide deacetylase family protein [Desulfovibrio sp.]
MAPLLPHPHLFSVGLILLLLCLPQPLCAKQACNDIWTMQPKDQKKALPNLATPPQRLRPLTTLSPLPASQIGTIRSVTLPTQTPLLALTFDLCELATSTSGCDMELLAFLREQKIAATLFMGGKWMRTHKDRVKQILQEPLFEIGNHNWTHGNCALLPNTDLIDQILWTQAEYELIREEVLSEAKAQNRPLPEIAEVPRLFRLPYGRSTPAALKTIAALGLATIQWNVVGEVAQVKSRKQARQCAEQLIKAIQPGAILLFHANLVPVGTNLLVQELTALLQAKGYRFVTVSQLLKAGSPNLFQESYFTHPKDNLILDTRFGRYGTGFKR